MGTTSSLPQEDYVGAAVVSTILADGGFETGASAPSSTTVSIEAGRLSDVDPWGRFRITGTGRPPF